MVKRGPRSAAAQAVAPIITKMGKRPVPVASLSAEERSVWDSVVPTKPTAWFTPEIIPLLENYCQAAAMARFLAGRITELQATSPVDEPRLFALLKAKDRETRGATSLATKLRLTPQSRYTPATAARQHEAHNAAGLIDTATGRRTPRPWEDPATGLPYPRQATG